MRHYLDADQKNWVRQWWRALDPIEKKGQLLTSHPDLSGLGHQARARLRRCTSVQSLLLEPATYKLAERLMDLEREKGNGRFAANYAAVALVAGVLACVQDDAKQPESLAAELGKERNGRKCMSELRFTQLMRARTDDDFLRLVRRAIHLAGRETNVPTLANDILAWWLEKDPSSIDINDRLYSRWARDYYLSARAQSRNNNPSLETTA